MSLRYPIQLAPDDNGTLLVTVPAFPEITTFGENKDDALLHARDAIEEAIAARIAAKQEIPETGRLRGRSHTVQMALQTEIKVKLYRSLRRAKLTRADLARRLHWRREQVDRLFRLDHASRLDQLDAAFSALGIQIGELTAALWAEDAEEISLDSLTRDELASAYIRGQIRNIRKHGEDLVFIVGERGRLVLRHNKQGKVVETRPEGLRAFRYKDEIFFAP